jgi:hypothetical protein
MWKIPTIGVFLWNYVEKLKIVKKLTFS